MLSRRYLALVLVLWSLVIPQFASGALATARARPVGSRAPQQAATQASPTPDPNDPIERIKNEETNHSQVMETLEYLSDVIGPRLTASPAMKQANEWTRERLASWGLQNAHLEAWGPFGRGWTLTRFSAQVTEPLDIPLIAYPKAWSPGTNGPLTADVIYVDANTEADLAKYKGRLKGAIVLTGPPRDVKAHFEPLGARQTEKDLLRLADAPDPRTVPARRFQFTPEQRAAARLLAAKYQFFTSEGAAVLVDPSRAGDGGTIFVQQATVPQPFAENQFGPPAPGATRRFSAWDRDAPRFPPQVVVAIEQYNRMIRMLRQGQKLRMTVDIGVQFQDKDPMGYNTVAEIPGTDLKDEVVMLGGHMDSWHAGTGATDNGAGVAVAMEAVRLIQTLGLKPRRTIRVALWTGEEEGLLGSRAYVAEHFGAPAAPGSTPPARFQAKPEYEKLDAYFNLDNGTGRIRGVYLQGNDAVRLLFQQWLAPFRDMGAETLTLSNTGSTDHVSFDTIGLPGFQFIQDEIEYSTMTHHSNQDVFDRIQGDDLKQASMIMAAFVYNTAMRNEKLPRKPMPGQQGNNR